MRIGIVGGGVYGAAIAYFLSEFGDGDEEVVVFEKGDLGGVSSAKSAGIVRHHYSNREHIEIMSRGREIYEELESHIGRDGGYHNNGFLAVTGPDHEEPFREIVRLQREIGLDVELLDPEEIPEYMPGFDPEGLAAGAFEREGGFADPYQVATGFAEAAGENGVDLRANTAVEDVRLEGGRPVALETEGGREPVDYVVNAGGPYAHRVAAMVGVDLPLSWVEVKIAVLRADEPYTRTTPSTANIDAGIYTKPESGDFLVGGFNDPEMDSPDAAFETVTNDDLLAIGDYLEERLPRFADAELVNTWSGVITPTPDWHQIIGVPEGLEGFYNVAGGSGHGFKEAAGFSESIAQEVLGVEPRHDLSMYRLERFERGEGIESRYPVGWLA